MGSRVLLTLFLPDLFHFCISCTIVTWKSNFKNRTCS